jgi:hypothetical protein
MSCSARSSISLATNIRGTSPASYVHVKFPDIIVPYIDACGCCDHTTYVATNGQRILSQWVHTRRSPAYAQETTGACDIDWATEADVVTRPRRGNASKSRALVQRINHRIPWAPHWRSYQWIIRSRMIPRGMLMRTSLAGS